jgi:hypothetical protein
MWPILQNNPLGFHTLFYSTSQCSITQLRVSNPGARQWNTNKTRPLTTELSLRRCLYPLPLLHRRELSLGTKSFRFHSITPARPLNFDSIDGTETRQQDPSNSHLDHSIKDLLSRAGLPAKGKHRSSKKTAPTASPMTNTTYRSCVALQLCNSRLTCK